MIAMMDDWWILLAVLGGFVVGGGGFLAFLVWLENSQNRRYAEQVAAERQDWEDWPEWWAFPPRDRTAYVVAMRHGWNHPVIFRPCDASPAMNAAGLHWKPWEGETVEHIPLAAAVAPE